MVKHNICFVKEYTYDSFGRLSTQKQEAKDKLSNITVECNLAMYVDYPLYFQNNSEKTLALNSILYGAGP